MGDLTRRNKPTPVQAVRKPPAEQVLIDVPTAAAGAAAPSSQPPPAQPASVTQNIFYISAPPAGSSTPPPSAPASPPQQPPQEVHYHTTVHHAPARSRGPRHRLSFFGSAGVVLGGIAIAALYVPKATQFCQPLAMAGVAA